MNNEESSDSEALLKWMRIPKADRIKIEKSFFCSDCGLTTAACYTLSDSKYGILMKGSCKKCGGTVVRLIDDLWLQ
jgi:transcription elongation factor Elf1